MAHQDGFLNFIFLSFRIHTFNMLSTIHRRWKIPSRIKYSLNTFIFKGRSTHHWTILISIVASRIAARISSSVIESGSSKNFSIKSHHNQQLLQQFLSILQLHQHICRNFNSSISHSLIFFIPNDSLVCNQDQQHL